MTPINPDVEKAIQHARNIHTLIIDYNMHLTNLEFDLQIIPLLQENILTSFSCQYNKIGFAETHALAETLKVNTTLTKLSLEPEELHHEEAIEFAETLKVNTSLTSFKLKTLNKIDLRDGIVFSEALKVNTTLSSFTLGLLGPGVAIAFVEALKVNTTLTSFNIWGTQLLSTGDAIEFAKVLKVNTSLTSFSTDGNIDPEGAIAFADALKVNTTLTSFVLSRSELRLEDAIAFAEALKVNTTLTSLSFTRNNLSYESVLAIIEALQENRTLTSLTISTNYLGNEATILIADALKKNTTLTSLNLEWNDIGSKGEQAIIEALKINKTLTTLVGIKNPEIGILLLRNRAELLKKRNQRIETIKKLQQLPDMNSHLMQEILSYSGFESTKQQEHRTSRMAQQEQEVKQKHESELNPVKRIVDFIDTLPSTLKAMDLAGKTTDEIKQKIISDIDETIKRILKDAQKMGHIFKYIPDPKKGRDATTGDDTETIRNVISTFETNFKKTDFFANTHADLMSEISHKLRRAWNRVIDEYAVNNPVNRIINLIDRLKTQIKIYGVDKEQYEEMITEIKERMNGIIEDNTIDQYCFQEHDLKKISDTIKMFKNMLKTLTSISEQAKSGIIQALKDEYALVLSDSSHYTEMHYKEMTENPPLHIILPPPASPKPKS